MDRCRQFRQLVPVLYAAHVIHDLAQVLKLFAGGILQAFRTSKDHDAIPVGVGRGKNVTSWRHGTPSAWREKEEVVAQRFMIPVPECMELPEGE